MKDPQNPFVHKISFSRLQVLKIGVFGVILLPIRLLIALICLTLSTTIATIGLYGLTDEDLDRQPFVGWRLMLRSVICYVLRFMFFCCGFHRLKVKGRPADPEEAPIVVLAPHSTFFDALVVVSMGGPSVVAKAETSSIPFWGSLIRYTQPVLVHRNDPNSRQNTIRQIAERGGSKGNWQQVLIFPEGTCTNRSCLITFRLGSFYPGVPIQPVCIRYPNTLDTVTWTWEGIAAWKVLAYSLSQFCINCEIEYLPPYVPDKKELDEPKLFAANVRAEMARRLEIPTTDSNYFDYLRIEKSQQRLKALQKLQRRMEQTICERTEPGGGEEASRVVALEELAALLQVGTDLPELDTVLSSLLLDETGDRVIDCRQLRLAALIATEDDGLRAIGSHGFSLFDEELGGSHITSDSFLAMVRNQIFLSHKEATELLSQLAVDDKVEASQFLEYLNSNKPNYVKVLRSIEGQLTSTAVGLLIAKSAGMVAASGSSLISAGKEVVSDVSAKMAAGKEKMTDAISSRAAVGFSMLSAPGENKSKSE